MTVLVTGPKDAEVLVMLAHGAGAGMDSPFMAAMAAGLAARGVAVLRFEFPYMAARRATGGKRPPDRAPVLLDCWRRVLADHGAGRRVVIGGKSMGGRMASMIADDAGVAGLLCLGYPFHPPGRPDRTRTAHLGGLRTPALIIQGTRDPFGTRDEVQGYDLSPAIAVRWIEDGDHDLTPRKSSGLTEAETWDEAIAMIAAFIREM